MHILLSPTSGADCCLLLKRLRRENPLYVSIRWHRRTFFAYLYPISYIALQALRNDTSGTFIGIGKSCICCIIFSVSLQSKPLHGHIAHIVVVEAIIITAAMSKVRVDVLMLFIGIVSYIVSIIIAVVQPKNNSASNGYNSIANRAFLAESTKA